MTRAPRDGAPDEHHGEPVGDDLVPVTSPGAFLATPPQTAEAQRLFDADQSGVGYVTNVSRLWAYTPAALDALSDLMSEVTRTGSLTLAQRSVLVTAAASTLGDSYCSMAWGNKLADATSPDVAAGVIQGDAEGLDQADRALATWACLLANDANATTAEDVQKLRSAGFDDAQIFAITVYVALRLAFSTVNDALGAVPDSKLASTTPELVRSAISFGRPADIEVERDQNARPVEARD